MRLLLLILTSFSPAVLYASVLVEKIQMPAWKIHGQQKSVLLPGAQLESGDRVITGRNARVYLKLSEGSQIKIGEKGAFEIQSLTDQKLEVQVDGSLFNAVFNVLKGAFRFTTNGLFKNRKRDIDINIGTVTAGIRGTDLWGKSTQGGDLVCLIEGRITVSKYDQSKELVDSRTYLSSSAQQSLSEIRYVSDDELARWAASTDIAERAGVISINGQYTVQLVSVARQNDANKLLSALHEAGYAARMVEKVIQGSTWYRVSVTGFDSLEGARKFAGAINGRFSHNIPWVF